MPSGNAATKPCCWARAGSRVARAAATAVPPLPCSMMIVGFGPGVGGRSIRKLRACPSMGSSACSSAAHLSAPAVSATAATSARRTCFFFFPPLPIRATGQRSSLRVLRKQLIRRLVVVGGGAGSGGTQSNVRDVTAVTIFGEPVGVCCDQWTVGTMLSRIEAAAMNPTLDLGPIIAGAVLLAAGLGFLQAAKLANRRITSRLRLILVLPCSVLGFAACRNP